MQQRRAAWDILDGLEERGDIGLVVEQSEFAMLALCHIADGNLVRQRESAVSLVGNAVKIPKMMASTDTSWTQGSRYIKKWASESKTQIDVTHCHSGWYRRWDSNPHGVAPTGF